MARKVIIVFAVLMMFLGAGVFIYPVFSNLYYEKMEEDRLVFFAAFRYSASNRLSHSP